MQIGADMTTQHVHSEVYVTKVYWNQIHHEIQHMRGEFCVTAPRYSPIYTKGCSRSRGFL